MKQQKSAARMYAWVTQACGEKEAKAAGRRMGGYLVDNGAASAGRFAGKKAKRQAGKKGSCGWIFSGGKGHTPGGGNFSRLLSFDGRCRICASVAAAKRVQGARIRWPALQERQNPFSSSGPHASK